MKIALCLHGYFNSQKDLSSFGEDGYKHIEKHIFKYENVDVYIHTWDLKNKEIIEKLYGKFIKKAIFEPQIDFKPLYNQNGLSYLPHHGTPFWNAFSQYYSVQKSIELMIESEINYDVVIKARFDLSRINRRNVNAIPVQCINFDPNLDMNIFYMADWGYLEKEGPADMWFYSNKENMSKFSKIFDILSNDIKANNTEYQLWAGHDRGGIVNTVRGWKWFMIKTGLWDKKGLLKTYYE
jgi:hypothetical protein